MDQRQAHRRYFDSHAADYDAHTADGAWTPNQYLAGVLRTLAAQDVEVRTALDLGTGTGQTLEVVRAAFPQARLWASDLSPAMLRHAALKAPDAHFEVADISSHVTGLTESFDLVTAVGCLEMVEDLMTVLPRLMPHLNPGGQLRSSHLFTAYHRAGAPVLYELLLIGKG
ncbi:MAG TPA: class I SAM-dependent methyltransferase [Jatrophihabitans sp.]|jgi:trans-aconitate methyltransferase|uniref:class I SAM-dependent methyltransferase n=1 Tax=Jatrophihabitans sp. TaxID=1932789 RepID=UPI002F0F9041